MSLQAWHYENECQDCGKNWFEHRSGYSASKCKREVPAPPNKLKEAIEWIENEGSWLGSFSAEMLSHGDYPSSREEAIATILNAVVKGELK